MMPITRRYRINPKTGKNEMYEEVVTSDEKPTPAQHSAAPAEKSLAQELHDRDIQLAQLASSGNSQSSSRD